MIWLKIIKKLLKALNADVSPNEIALGAVFGGMIGLTPAFALHNVIIFILIIILKVNISAAIVSSIIFGILGFFIDPLAHIIGEKLLFSDGLERIWTILYNIPVVPLTGFNNTVTLGSILIALILALPIYSAAKKFVVLYRTKLKDKVEKMKIVKLLKASKIYKIYTTFRP